MRTNAIIVVNGGSSHVRCDFRLLVYGALLFQGGVLLGQSRSCLVMKGAIEARGSTNGLPLSSLDDIVVDDKFSLTGICGDAMN